MASYTDSPLNAGSFHPYVQQIPVEAETAVGTTLQNRYDQGYQRIQSQIDKVAGLSVMKDVDKTYLKSKMNELGNNLRMVSMGDFSNYQLVNSVGGMVNQVGSDKNIQNAVMSTAWHQKQTQQIQDDIKAGKQNPANIYDFSIKSDAWLNSPKVGEVFNSSYQSPIDYKKKWTDALAKLHTNLTSQDIMNAMDSSGNIATDKLTAAMTRTKTEGVSAAQIENAINSTLGPEDLNQLAIEGRYRFKDASPEQLQQAAITYNKQDEAVIDRKIEALTGYMKLNTSNTDEYNKTKKVVDELTKRKQDMENALPGTLSDIQNNPDEGRYQLYKRGAIDEFSNAFSWEHRIVEHMTNPALESQIQLDNLSLRRQEFGLRGDEFSWKKYMDVKNFDQKDREIEIQREKLHPSGGAYSDYLGQNTDLLKDPLTSMQSDVVSKKLQAENIINEYLKSPEAKGITRTALESQLGNWSENKNLIPAEWRSRLRQVVTNREDADAINKTIETQKEKILNTPELKTQQANIDGAINNIPGVVLHIGDSPIQFTGRELYEYTLKKQKATGEGGDIHNISSVDYYSHMWHSVAKSFSPLLHMFGGKPSEDTSNPSGFTSKELLLDKYIQSQKNGNNFDEKNTLASVLGSVGSIANANSKFEAEKGKKLMDNLSAENSSYIPHVSVIPTDNEKSRRDVESLVGLALNVYNDPNGTPGGTKNLSPGQVKDLQTLISTGNKDRDALQYKKLVQGDNTFILVQHGKDEIPVPVNVKLANQLPRAIDEPSPEDERLMKRYALGGGYTNPDHNVKDAYFKTFDFPNVKNLSISAELAQDKDLTGWNYVTLYLKCPSGWKSLKLNNNPMDLTNIYKSVLSMTDDQIKELFMERGPQEAKEEIKNLP